jgi:hypothetical protein
MRTFTCSCGARLFFENSRCLQCSSELGFLPERGELAALAPSQSGHFEALGGRYRKCQNYEAAQACNWMIPADDEHPLCRACRLNNVIPDLSEPQNRALWAEVEKAKRRLVYGLDRLGLPVVPKSEDPERGLLFDIKADAADARVLTGHADGLITLNLGEADPVWRERMRTEMKERYRTLLGHFRHEIGHYYWDVLVRDAPALPAFRDLFGDEREDYQQALERHYATERSPGLEHEYISSYAASHPWEDWAETFAHYLHLRDTLDTARHFGFVGATPSTGAGRSGWFSDWVELTVALNALNRSMGQPDAYPFAISAKVRAKLEFVGKLVAEQAANGASRGRS